MIESTASICPFTLATTRQDDVAVIYQYNPLLSRDTAGCGHSCTLSRLVPYLHDRGGKVCCPVCQSTLASVICDSSSSAFLLQSQEEHRLTKKEAAKEDDGRIISFRYGAAFYYLWVPSSPPLPSSSYSCSALAKSLR
jgi:hypothetical protein